MLPSWSRNGLMLSTGSDHTFDLWITLFAPPILEGTNRCYPKQACPYLTERVCRVRCNHTTKWWVLGFDLGYSRFPGRCATDSATGGLVRLERSTITLIFLPLSCWRHSSGWPSSVSQYRDESIIDMIWTKIYPLYLWNLRMTLNSACW